MKHFHCGISGIQTDNIIFSLWMSRPLNKFLSCSKFICVHQKTSFSNEYGIFLLQDNITFVTKIIFYRRILLMEFITKKETPLWKPLFTNNMLFFLLKLLFMKFLLYAMKKVMQKLNKIRYKLYKS